MTAATVIRSAAVCFWLTFDGRTPMRRTIAASAAIALLSSAAVADDAFNHAGPYAGIVAGYSAAALQTPGSTVDWAAAGAQGGVFIGSGIVGRSGLYVGTELDLVAKDLKWSTNDGAGTTVTASGHWMGSARVRVGQTIGPMLLYGTVGAAVTDQRLAMTGFNSETDWRYGWVAGAGAEAQISRAIAIRFEALRYDFPDKTFSFAGGDAKLGTQETVVRLGVSFKLQ